MTRRLHTALLLADAEATRARLGRPLTTAEMQAIAERHNPGYPPAPPRPGIPEIAAHLFWYPAIWYWRIRTRLLRPPGWRS
jgi:hypothetical protein